MLNEMEQYLRPGLFTNSDHPLVHSFVEQHSRGIGTDLERVLALYYAVRDGFRYNPFDVQLLPEHLKASHLLGRQHGYCVEKSNLFAAAARAMGIPSRLGFAIVRNHLATERLEAVLGTDLLVFHGYAELWLGGRWVKATPVFDAELCRKLGVHALDFNGKEDSMFQESDKTGNPFMDYVHDYGLFADVPFSLFVMELYKHYRPLFDLPFEQRPFPWRWEADLALKTSSAALK